MNDKIYNLENKVAAITGSSRGIGFAIAEEFLKNGATVVISSRTESVVKETIGVLTKSAVSSNIAGHVLDVRSRPSVESFFKFIEDKFGALDVLVNNAGVYRHTPAEFVSDHEWREVIDTNLFGTFLCSQCAFSLLKKKGGGSIINISSQAGRSGRVKGAHYNSSKAGVIGFTQGLAREWGKYNININAIAPGFIATEQAIKTTAEVSMPLEAHRNQTVIGRLGLPRDVAGLALFLSSDAAKFITGQTFLINGGSLII